MADLHIDTRQLPRIQIRNEFEARYWTRVLGVPRAQLSAVISAINRARQRIAML